MIRVTFLVILFALSYQSANSQTFNGRFVAWDTSPELGGAHEPKQQFIVEIQDEKSPAKVILMKVVYFAPTNSFRGGAKFLDVDLLSYMNLFKLRLNPPVEEMEKYQCNRFNNFASSKGKLIKDEKNEPILRFRSTQFAAEIKFKNLAEMPCMVLESIQ